MNFRVVSLAILAAATSLGGAATTPPSKAGAPATPSAAAVAQAEIPQSVFTNPASPKEGRNPFFPNSKMGQPEPKLVERPSQVDTSAFVLNGITSPPRRTAMINGRTFEIGEQGEVKLTSGARVMIKCLEIRDSSAIIQVGGQAREVRMRFGL